MYTRTIKYTDYDGVEREEKFYFNISKAEFFEMQLGVAGGYGEQIQQVINSKDVPGTLKIFKDLIRKAYGVKSADGKSFIKKAPDGHLLADDFEQTEAYSIMFMDLATNEEIAKEFLDKAIPKVEQPKQIPAK